MGVVSAILKFAKVDWFLTDWHATYGEAIAIIPLIALVIYVIMSSMKVQKQNNMESVKDKFLRYISFDTQSDPEIG